MTKWIITRKKYQSFSPFDNSQVISSSLCPKIILPKVLQNLAQSKTTKNAIIKTCLRRSVNGIKGEVDVWMLPQLPLTSRVVSLNRIVPSALEMDACKQTNKQKKSLAHFESLILNLLRQQFLKCHKITRHARHQYQHALSLATLDSWWFVSRPPQTVHCSLPYLHHLQQQQQTSYSS